MFFLLENVAHPNPKTASPTNTSSFRFLRSPHAGPSPRASPALSPRVAGARPFRQGGRKAQMFPVGMKVAEGHSAQPPPRATKSDPHPELGKALSRAGQRARGREKRACSPGSARSHRLLLLLPPPAPPPAPPCSHVRRAAHTSGRRAQSSSSRRRCRSSSSRGRRARRCGAGHGGPEPRRLPQAAGGRVLRAQLLPHRGAQQERPHELRVSAGQARGVAGRGAGAPDGPLVSPVPLQVPLVAVCRARPGE